MSLANRPQKQADTEATLFLNLTVPDYPPTAIFFLNQSGKTLKTAIPDQSPVCVAGHHQPSEFSADTQLLFDKVMSDF